MPSVFRPFPAYLEPIPVYDFKEGHVQHGGVYIDHAIFYIVLPTLSE